MRVLLVDLDPQGNATMGSGIDKRTLQTSIYQLLLDWRPPSRPPRSRIRRVRLIPPTATWPALKWNWSTSSIANRG